jgi:hypothetical protein
MMPFQGFVGLSSERTIVLFAVSALRCETRADFDWLIGQFYACYKGLASTWLTDGDAKIYGAVEDAARVHKLRVNMMLCVCTCSTT